MARGYRARLAAVAVILALAAPAAAGASRNLYVSNAGSSNVSGFSLAADGALTPLPTSPYSTGTSSGPQAVVFTPDGRYAFVVSGAGEYLSTFRVGTDGALAELGSSPMTIGTAARGAAVTPDGAHLYLTNAGSGTVQAFGINADGSLSDVTGSPYTVPGALGLAVTPDGEHLFVARSTEAAISGFDIAADGSLVALADTALPLDSAPQGMTLTPDGAHLYVADDFDNTVFGFNVEADGNLVPVGGTPADFEPSPYVPISSPDGRHLYVPAPNRGSSPLGAYDIAPAGTLTAIAGSPYSTGGTFQFPTSPVLSPDGRHFFVADRGPPSALAAYDVAASGALTAIPGPMLPTGAAPDFQALAFNPDQGPTASFSAEARAGAGGTVDLDASASADPDGVVARYDWDFGDGRQLTDGGQQPSHDYAPGSYTASLTVTDGEGCSTAYVGAGQTATCNGGAAATATRQVLIEDRAVDGAKLSAKRKQKQRGGKIVVKLKAGAAEDVEVLAAGRIKAGARTYPFAKLSRTAAAGRVAKLKLKLKRPGDATAVTRALDGSVKAIVSARFRDAAGNAEKRSKTIRLEG